QPAIAAQATALATNRRVDIACTSALDRGRIEWCAVGVAGEERRQCDRRVGPEHELGKTLLAEAVVEPPLEGPELALRHAIRGPGRVRILRAFRRREVRQVLQPNALAIV